jgi:hypothetical protein
MNTPNTPSQIADLLDIVIELNSKGIEVGFTYFQTLVIIKSEGGNVVFIHDTKTGEGTDLDFMYTWFTDVLNELNEQGA